MIQMDFPVSEFMTTGPQSVTVEETLATARRRMDNLRFRHLAVYDRGQLTGIISQRDLDVAAALPNIDLHTVTVGTTMKRDPFCVAPTMTVRDVASAMAERTIGSALVVDAETSRLLGIFTVTDALKLLAYT